MYEEHDYSPDELEHMLNNELFMNIQGVGIHGGEPFLKNDLVDYVQVVIKTLPKLKKLEFTSNGYFTKNMVNMLIKIKQLCCQFNIKIILSLSLDAIGELHDFVRGKRGAFSQIQETCDILLRRPDLYYDSISFICTLTKYNIYNVNEVEFWAVNKGINVSYDVAVENGRLCNQDKYTDFTIFNDPLALKMAQEFFLRKYYETLSHRYFCMYYYLLHGERIAQCDFQYNTALTLTPGRQLVYCTAYYKELGDAYICDAKEIFYDNLDYKNYLCEKKCPSCSHWMGSLSRKGFLLYCKNILNRKKMFY
jgi:MoaA/NifB/PqqE/SkfB family radical SAM enzyme